MCKSHTFVEIDHEIFSTVLLIQERLVPVQAKVSAQVLVNCLVKLAQEKEWLG